MSATHRPPDTGREVSELKRRVTGLERMLDRVRRDLNQPASGAPLSFAAIRGAGFSDAGMHTDTGDWHYSRPLNTMIATVPDPTQRITVDTDPFGQWTLRVDVAGVYLFGVVIAFDDSSSPTGDRLVAVQEVDNGGIVATHDIATTGATARVDTVVSGVTPVQVDAGTFWWPMYGDDVATVLPGSCLWFWALAVSDHYDVAYVGST